MGISVWENLTARCARLQKKKKQEEIRGLWCMVYGGVGPTAGSKSSQVKCLIPISQRAAKAVRAKTLRVLVVFCGAAPPVFRLPDGLIYVSFHSHSQFDFFWFFLFDFFVVILSKKTCASRRVIGVSFHLSLPLDSFQLGLLFRPEMLSPVPSLHRVEFCCGFLFGVTSLLVRVKSDPSRSWRCVHKWK